MRSTSEAAAFQRRASSWLGLAAVLMAAALTIVGPALHSPGEGMPLIGLATDGLPGALWLDAWTAAHPVQAVLSGHSNAIYWPIGADTMVRVGGPLPGLLSMSFQWVFGHPGFWTPFVLAALVCNGLAAAWLARRVGAEGAGVWLAALAFLLAPPLLREVGAGAQHVFWAAPLPITLGLGLQALDGRRRDAVLAGASLGVAGLFSWESALMAAVVLGVLWLRKVYTDAAERRDLADRWGWMARAWVPFGVLLLPLLAERTRSGGTHPGWLDLPEAIPDSASARIAFVEASHHVLPLGDLVGLADRPEAQLVSIASLLLLAAWFTLFGIRRMMWPTVVIVSAVLAAGAWLPPSWDVSDGWLPLPLAWVESAVPGGLVIARPERLMVLAALGQAMMLGLLWRPAVNRFGAQAGAGLAVLVGAGLAAGPWMSGVAPLPVFDWQPPAWLQAIDGPGAVIHLPLGWSQGAALWQPVHGNPVAGGPGEAMVMADESAYKQMFDQRPGLAPLWKLDAGSFDDEDLAALRSDGAGWIVVHEGVIDSLVIELGDVRTWVLPSIAQRVRTAFGPPVYAADGVSVYRVEAEH